MPYQIHKYRYSACALFVVVLCCQLMISGCEPLRRKFIRKKRKSSLEATADPILDPEAYPEKVYDAEQVYRSHYGLCLIWNKEIIANLEENMSDKKTLFSLNKLLNELREMELLVTEGSQDTIRIIKEKVEKIINEFSEQAAYRNNRSYIKKLGALDRQLRKELKLDKILNDLNR